MTKITRCVTNNSDIRNNYSLVHLFYMGGMHAQNQKIRHVVATGRIYEEILRLATQTDAGLIVVGAHKADLKDYLLGPNAARIVRHANCSVYVVR